MYGKKYCMATNVHIIIIHTHTHTHTHTRGIRKWLIAQEIHRGISFGQVILILVNKQLDAQFFPVYAYFRSLHVLSTHVLIIRRITCIDTTSGICHSVSVTFRYAVPSKHAYQTVTYIKWHIPDVVLIQLILLMMSTWVLETCRELK